MHKSLRVDYRLSVFSLIIYLTTCFLLLASPSHAQDLATCETATDCRGFLPQYCMVCPTGEVGGCAHWSCIENQCAISTCDIPSSEH